MPVLQKPWRVTASLKGGVITARHPWLKDKLIRLGVRKLPRTEQTVWLTEVQKLLDAAPRHKNQAPADVRDTVIDSYFRALALEDAVSFDVRVDRDGRVDGMQINPGDAHAYVVLKGRLAEAEECVAELRRDKEQLQAQVAALVRAAGQRTEEEKKTTLRECWERFGKLFRLRPGAQSEERRNVIRRVKHVLEQLGWERRYASIELADVEQALSASQAATETEYSKRAADIKRFFSFLCLPRSQNGLGFSVNPGRGLRYLGPTALQRKRRNKGLVIAADDPNTILPRLEPYWRAVYATLCYSGLRLGELAALPWRCVDFEGHVLSVLPSPDYLELKSELSERAVKPFKELWPILKEHRQSSTGKGLLFPRPSDGKSWFLDVLGHGKVNHLSRGLSRALKRAGMKDVKEPGRRARRYWETRMRAIGRPDLIPLMGGHSDAVGRGHYA